jgi:transcriptional regulator with XRE-family HTH domain
MKVINLKHYRTLAVLTQNELASKSVCTESASLEIGTGKRPPRVRTLKKLAYALDTDTRAIVGNRH